MISSDRPPNVYERFYLGVTLLRIGCRKFVQSNENMARRCLKDTLDSIDYLKKATVNTAERLPLFPESWEENPKVKKVNAELRANPELFSISYLERKITELKEDPNKARLIGEELDKYTKRLPLLPVFCFPE